MILLTDKVIKELCVKHLAWDEPVSNRDLELVKPLFKAQLKRIAEWLNIEIIKIPVSKTKDANEDYNLLAGGINKIMQTLLKGAE